MNKTTLVSWPLVGCMLLHAADGLFRDLSPSERHLITSVSLITPSSIASIVHTGIHHSAITEAVYLEPPRAELLKNGGLAFPNAMGT